MKKYLSLLLISPAILFGGCSKFLDEKPDKKLAVPSTLNDLKLLLQNTNVLNQGNTSTAESFADNYYITTTAYINSGNEATRQKYVWGDESFPNTAPSSEWSKVFQQVYVANVVFESLQKIERTNSNAVAWDEVKGSASFFRAKGWFEALSLWAPPYDSVQAAQTLGIPLHTEPDFEKSVPRASLKASVEAVVKDFTEASLLCPEQVMYKTNPTRAAAQAMLSRVYLYLRQYDNCVLAASKCLEKEHTLMNYNNYSSSLTFPFTYDNPEVIFVGLALADGPATSSLAIVDSNLYRSYETNDLRRTLYFKPNTTGEPTYKGSYSGSGLSFIGPAVDEVILNYAEALARLGKAPQAIEEMNKLLVTRYKTGTYQPKLGLNQQQTLDWVLTERRKELLYRGIRWTDIKRLHYEVRYQTTVVRIIPSGEVRLVPGDKRYAAIIPEDAIVFGGLQQNPR